MSSIRLIHAYWRERYPKAIFLPFAILLAVVGSAATGSRPTIREFVIGCVIAFTLVLVFRIVDDLADLNGDRRSHPTRVLVQASSVTPVAVFALVIAAVDVGISLWLGAVERMAVFVSLSLFLLLWYSLRARLNAGPLASAHVVLLKYPVISLLTSARWDKLTLPSALLAFGTIYLGMCIYEQVHDRAVRDSRAGSWIFAAEVGLLVCIPLLIFSTGGFLR